MQGQKDSVSFNSMNREDGLKNECPSSVSQTPGPPTNTWPSCSLEDVLTTQYRNLQQISAMQSCSCQWSELVSKPKKERFSKLGPSSQTNFKRGNLSTLYSFSPKSAFQPQEVVGKHKNRNDNLDRHCATRRGDSSKWFG